jgi:cell division protein YceG involved in septum cleavage
MNKTKKPTTNQNIQAIAIKLKKFAWLIILIFFLIIYGYIYLKINSFESQQPSSSAISSDLKTSVQPTINPKVVQQLETLKNNSVSVQALFNQARHNPF